MDADYGRNLDGAATKAFEPSLLVWATVMSRPAQDRAIVDAGLKSARLRFRRAAGSRRARRDPPLALTGGLDELERVDAAITYLPISCGAALRLSNFGGGRMTKVEIELSDARARAAREAGLLTSEALERLLRDAIRRREAADALLGIAERVGEAGIEPMPMEEVDREVKAVRAERRRRASAS
jgi:hypothetical protein